MTIVEDMARLGDELRGVAHISKTDIRTFPSGAVNLDVHCGGRLFVIAYFPSHQMFCVDEARPEDGIGTDFRFGFKDFHSAKEKLLGLLKERS